MINIPHTGGLKKEVSDGIKIPVAQRESIDPSSVVIPSYITGSALLNLFGRIGNSFLNSQIISMNESIAEIKVSVEGGEVENTVDTLIGEKLFAPDAVPDGKGGYSQGLTGYWNKRLSSVNGQPVMCPITFVGTSYTALNGQVITIPTITFEMVLISMKKGRNIEKTGITGRDTGTVKEYISANDWTIEIRAIVMASQNVAEGMTDFYQEGKYPEENMEKIDLLLDAPIAIKVICPYLNNRGINYIVIDDGVDISQIEGEYEAQRITIPCLSDNPLIIQVETST